MPMMRATFFFKDTNGYGWTETFHNLLTTYTGVIGNVNSIIPARVGMLTQNAALVYVRVSDDDVFRDSQVITVSPGDGTGTIGGNGTHADLALITRSIPSPLVTSLVRKTTYVRGLPQKIVGAAGAYAPNGVWNDAFGTWAGFLQNGNWAIRTINRLLVPSLIVNAVQVLPSGVVTVTTQIPHGITVPGTGIKISGVVGATQINGKWNVQTIPSVTTFTIQIADIMGAFVAGGTVIPVGFQLLAITKSTDERIAERKAGRPFDSPRGRRRGRKRT